MSTNYFEAELDDVLENLRTDFIKKKKKEKSSSASSTFHKPHDIGAVSATLRTIMDRENPPPPIIFPTTSSSNNKRSTNSAAETSTAKFQRLDDDEAIGLYSQQSIEELKEELLEQYIINDQLPLLEEDDDGVEEGTVDIADGDEESDDEEVQWVTICEPCPPVSKKHRSSSDNDLKNYAFTRPQMNIARCSSSSEPQAELCKISKDSSVCTVYPFCPRFQNFSQRIQIYNIFLKMRTIRTTKRTMPKLRQLLFFC
jgi:hypothetical protein